MIYLEFSDIIVERGFVPSKVCMADVPLYKDGKCGIDYKIIMMADKVYEVQGNSIVYFKDRFGNIDVKDYISDEDRIMLRLKAVLI